MGRRPFTHRSGRWPAAVSAAAALLPASAILVPPLAPDPAGAPPPVVTPAAAGPGTPGPPSAPAGPARPFPRHTAYAAGALAPGRWAQARLDADVAAYYDRWKADFVVPAGTDLSGAPLYRVVWNPGQESESISESQGYGLVIAANLAGHDPAARELFDGIYRYVRLHPSAGDGRLTRWHTPVTAWHHAYAAFDGDADIAYGLLLADLQWGSTGPIDYRAQARRTLDGLSQSALGPLSGLPLIGDSALRHGPPDPGLALADQYTIRVSDLMPAHFRSFARLTADPRWSEAVTGGQTVVAALQQAWSAGTGLVPDFAVPPPAGAPSLTNLRPADPCSVEGQVTDGRYGYNSARVPWRFGLDFLLSGDPASRAIAGRLARWADTASAGDPVRLVGGYELDGQPGSTDFAPAFIAPMGVAAMGVPSGQAFLDAVYDLVHGTHRNYYADTVTLLCLLVMTANYLAA